jgi:hypothetical protein
MHIGGMTVAGDKICVQELADWTGYWGQRWEARLYDPTHVLSPTMCSSAVALHPIFALKRWAREVFDTKRVDPDAADL